jgi:hypothetical protein
MSKGDLNALADYNRAMRPTRDSNAITVAATSISARVIRPRHADYNRVIEIDPRHLEA